LSLSQLSVRRVVEYRTPEDARQAIRTLNDTDLLGRPVFIREVRIFDRYDICHDCIPLYKINNYFNRIGRVKRNLVLEYLIVPPIEVVEETTMCLVAETTPAVLGAMRADKYSWEM